MKGRVIDKKLIESIVRKDNDDYIKNVGEKLNYVLSNAIDDLSHQIAYVNLDNTILQPANELLSGAFTDNSKFVYFLGIDSAQLELNTLSSSNFWKSLKNKVVYAWKMRSNRSRKRWQKRKKKKDEKAAQSIQDQIYDFDPSKYNIFNLLEDLQTATAKYCALTSIVYLENDHIRIIGKDDFGSNTQIIIYPTIFNGETFKYYAGRRKGFVEIDFNSRNDLLEQKYDKVGQSVIDMIKVFNVLYFYANKRMPNQLFIESLLCSCPDQLFEGENSYSIFVKIINYLTMTSIKDVQSINDPEKTIFEDKIVAANSYDYRNFIDQFVYLNQTQTAKKSERVGADKKKRNFKIR